MRSRVLFEMLIVYQLVKNCLTFYGEGSLPWSQQTAILPYHGPDNQFHAEKSKYIVMSCQQNAEQNHNTKIDKASFKSVDQFRYLGTTLTNRNLIHEETKSRLKSGNACYHSVQILLSTSFLSKSITIKICRTIIFTHGLYRCETLVTDIEGGTKAESVEENIWA
jgi:hypothetical protein